MIKFLLSGAMATALAITPGHSLNEATAVQAVPIPVVHEAAVKGEVQFAYASFNWMDDLYKQRIAEQEVVTRKVTIAQEMKMIAQEEERARIAAEEEKRIKEEKRIASVGFNPNNLLVTSNITAKELRNVLNNVTKGSGLAPYAEYFVECEEEYGVNALVLCALAALESGWGRHKGGNGTNITGYAVYSSKHNGKTFNGGIRDNLMSTARLLKEHYLTKGGKSYNGLSLRAVNTRYCLNESGTATDYNWSKSIESIASKLSNKYDELYK